MTVAGLANEFLTSKLRRVESGELGSRMFADYRETTDLIVHVFGKTYRIVDLTPNDFDRLRSTMAERWGPVRLSNVLMRVKSVFKFGYEAGLIDMPVRFGPNFRKPSASVLRRHRATSGKRMLEACELRRILDALAGKEFESRIDKETGEPKMVKVEPNPSLRAMTLLGLNCGFGNTDCATLPLAALDLERGWVDYPRPKTGIERRCPLWSETTSALREVVAARPTPKDKKADKDIVFLQPSGRRWVRLTAKSRRDNVSGAFADVLKELGLHREGIAFYTLRHIFRTIADEARDAVAIDLIMGHSDPSMGGRHRERIDDSRLQAVTDHVRMWLFGKQLAGSNQFFPATPSPSDSE